MLTTTPSNKQTNKQSQRKNLKSAISKQIYVYHIQILDNHEEKGHYLSLSYGCGLNRCI
jgi:hypothetical protein